jgi:hypothetical protein
MPASTPDLAASEWLILRSHRPNVLVTGSVDLIDAVLDTLRPELRCPIHEWSPERTLPRGIDWNTLLIRNVGALSMPQQCELLTWMEEHASRPIQIVSTSPFELLRLVYDGAFLDRLYYRLNTVRLDALTLTSQAGTFCSSAM